MNEEELKTILLQSKLFTSQTLEKILEEKKKLKRPLAQVILDMRLLSKEALYRTIAQKIGVEYKDLTDWEVAPELVEIYPADLARNTNSVPLFIENNFLHVAMEDPQNLSFIDQIQLFTGYPLEIYLSSASDIEHLINKIYYPKTQDLFSGLEVEESRRLSESSSITKIVDAIIMQGVRDRATDIHIEPEEDLTRIRFRIDGVLHEIPSPPKEWELAIISRIKVLSGMDIAESRLPQDGYFRRKIDNRIIDFRVSTLPTIYGENLVMRMLDTSSLAIGLERLGFTTPEDLKRYEELIAQPYGIILSTGPTGCGKTTTLYSSLMRINTLDRNIITVEDPVEYHLGVIRQVQINPKVGMTFAKSLRAIFRQDPDVIMIGEIRDLETARMVIQAALTGHLVFSTLHTNDAPSSIIRLIEMGIEPFLVSASLVGVMAQRLVRVICSKCKQSYKPSAAVLKKWGLDNKGEYLVYRGLGCEECRNTGFYGRTGIFELMSIDDEIREMIISGLPLLELKKKACQKGMKFLWNDGREKVLKGITTFEEVARVCEGIKLESSQSGVVEAKVYIKPQIEKVEKEKIPSQKVEIDDHELEEYRNKIARWLSKSH